MEEILQTLISFFADYTFRYVALGSAILGVASGALGSFAVLRRQSLTGDTLSHAALPGIAIAFLLIGAKEPLLLILGAGLTAWLGAMAVFGITNTTRLKQDAALGIVLSTFFAFGTVLLTFIQGSSGASQAGLDRFLFGQAAALVERDVVSIGVLAIAALVILVLFFKEFKLLTFDPDFGSSVGLPIKYLNILLTSLIVVAVVIGLQTVGVVLMVAMLIAPAAAARQWTHDLRKMIILSALFGAISGIIGALISSMVSNLSTGPIIVLTTTVILIISLLFSTQRGVVWSFLRQRRKTSLVKRVAP
jgi:manganese/zinc/iron transport system permease protein